MARLEIESMDLAELENMTNKELKALLKKSSRTANARAKYIKKVAPEYSAVYEFERGGKFGVHTTFKDRESMINELTRVKYVGQKLRARKAHEEETMLNNIVVQGSFENVQASEQVRRAFGWFKDGHDNVVQSVYNEVKAIMAQLPEEEYLTNAYNLVVKLINEKQQEENERKKAIFKDKLGDSEENNKNDLR